ncbi:hypothetical protein F4678DRAFT_468007 [Xylaria arbuscula]|nr:hypothetical protein F4678DRAFT_468007 [Xylaria arbuscula]
MRLSSALCLLAGLSGANAVDISGYATTGCTTTGVATCSGIYSNVCCQWPRGGLQVQSVLFSVLYEATIGVFYASSSSSYCSTSRAATSGYQSNVCVRGGILSNYFGGGGAWLDCTTQCNPYKRSLGTNELNAVANSQICNSSAIPTILGWEGEGVWVLQLEEGDTWDRYNELPSLDPADMTTHVENLKAFGAEWHANATEHPIATKFL